jgi:putative ABC transport system permease protein
LGAERQAAFAARVRRMPGVTDAAAGDPLFAGTSGTSFTPVLDDSTYGANALAPRYYQVGPRYTEALGIDVVRGRAFRPGRPADSSAVLLNLAAVAAYGWTPETALGKRLATDSLRVYEVIGLVEDFHFQSMRERVEPLALVMQHPHVATTDTPGSVFARLAPGTTPGAALADVRAAWQQMAGRAPFQYAFLDDTYDALHRDVLRSGRLFSLFAGLAVVIACLGLFGLAAYTVQRRAKEIGLRKALGASSAQVVGLLARQFLALVAVASVVALPAAYVAMTRWLEGFAYRTALGPGALLGAAALAALVAALTVAYHALRAARLDPAETLRSE